MRGALLTASMSENVTNIRSEAMAKIFRHIAISTHQNVEMSRAETMTKIFRHIAISTHKNVEMSRSETVYFFPTKKCSLGFLGRLAHLAKG